MQIRIPSVTTTMYALAFFMIVLGVAASVNVLVNADATGSGSLAIFTGLYIWYKADKRSKSAQHTS